jgi:hypothetical protein
MTSPQAATADLRSYAIYRHALRVFLALCILLAPLLLVFWFGLCPTGANDAACPDQGSSLSIVAAFRAMNSQLRQVFLALTLVIPFVYPVSYVGLGALAVRHAPWLTTLGVVCGFAAGVVWAAIAGQIALLDGMAQIALSPLFVTIENHFYSAWIVLALGAFWVIGHLVGYVLLGFALWRARVIPLWAALIFILNAPLMGPIAYGTNQGFLQILGFALIFIASIPAALAMLHSRDEQPLVE